MSVPDPSPVAVALALLNRPRERTVTIKATQARHDFFPLLEAVTADPDEVVEVEYKGRPASALLVNGAFRDYVRQLEEALRSFVAAAPGRPAFRLAGSLTLAEDVDAEVAALRADARRRADDRFADL